MQQLMDKVTVSKTLSLIRNEYMFAGCQNVYTYVYCMRGVHVKTTHKIVKVTVIPVSHAQTFYEPRCLFQGNLLI